jgi:DNA replication licensing factor MCM3
MIRLATSHAKLRLSKNVEPTDIDVAVSLLNESIFQEVAKPEKEEEPEFVDDENETMFDETEENEII